MIESLRKKFIIVAMCSTFAVLAAVMGIINVINYQKTVERADDMTELLARNNGGFDVDKLPKDELMEKKEERSELGPEGMSPETPFSTRYFTVTLDEDGNVLSADMSKIAAINQEEAETYAKEAFQKGKIKAFKEIYRYRVVKSGEDIKIIFLDCSQSLDSIRGFALISVSGSALGLLAVLILVLIFSKIVFKPVEESYEKQKQFITDASHEIKTPLTIIDANTEVMEMENGENQWTKSTRNQIKRLSHLTQQMITLSKLDEQSSVHVNSEFSLSRLIWENVEIFDVMAKTQDKVIHTDIEENIDFTGDKKAITQLVGILLDNAVKYSSNYACIQVSLKRKGKKILLRVYNPSDELPKGHLDVLFERFYRMDSSRNSQTGGSGIGLSVAKAIVMAHKGKIWAESEDGKSLKVTVELK